MARKLEVKISIIGAGAVGSAIAYALMLRGLVGELVLIDVNSKLANAEMLDIKHGLSCLPSVEIVCGDYADIKDSDMIIITAGRSRKEGESRLDLTQDNLKIASVIASNIRKNYNKGVVLVVSNPVDIITYAMSVQLGLADGMVFGTGCILDTSRLSSIVSEYIGRSVEVPVIGEHGSSQIALWNEISDCDLTDSQKIAMEDDVRAMGAEIIAGKGRTFFGISSCVCCIVEAVFEDKLAKMPVSVPLNGEYGLKDVALSVPCVVGKNGARIIDDIEFSVREQSFLQEAAKNLKSTYISVF